jgi:para-nitrobenzyl esterase
MIVRGMNRRGFLAKSAMAALSLQGRRLFAQVAPEPCVVKIPNGTLRGESSNGVRVFRGVPFAEPPIGSLRFRPPVKKASWTGERDAIRFAAAAMQPDDPAVSKSEDCLYLNVWAPVSTTAKPGKGMPVYVWIHGGGFTGGTSFAPIFDGTVFAREGIVCITVAYRLGVLGFLDVGPLLGSDYAGSGNNAVRDLILALRWVQENVAAFGGDPAQVTVGGESAGAKLTDILMGVPEAQGLFQQMISESGGAERVGSAVSAAAVAKGFGEVWGASGATGLKTAPATELIAAQKRFMDSWPQHFPLRVEVEGTLLPKLPVETIAGGSTRGKRLLIGTNRDESALFVGPHPAHDATGADLGNLPVARFQDVYAKYKAIYPEMNDEHLRIRALTAEEYWVPSERVAEAHVRGGGSAWMYRLDFAPNSGRFSGYAYHSEDLGLAWDKPNRNIDNAAAEAALASQVHQAWVAFIRGENPGAPGLPSWPQYRNGTRETMVFDVQSRVEAKPQEAELRLWDGVL